MDQLEEIFTLVEDSEHRRCFTQAICSAADDPQMPVRVVITVREEFLGRMADDPRGQEAMSHIVVLRIPETAALLQTLVRPVEALGFHYDDPGLTEKMVIEVEGEASCLPLLQFAGQYLWEHRDEASKELSHSVYESMGGVVGALANHADGVLAELPPGDARLARSILLNLVTEECTRRVVATTAVLDGLAANAESVLKKLIEARLVIARKSDKDDEAELELVHESLIDAWTTLRHWVEESREDLSFLHEASQAADLWDRRGRKEEEVWTGRALHDAQETLARCSIQIPSLVVQFIEAGGAQERSHTHRKRVIIVSGAVVLVLIALGAIVAAVVIAHKETETRGQKEIAVRQRASAQLEGARSAQAQGHLLEARAKLRASLQIQDSALARALWWKLSQNPLIWSKNLGGNVFDVAFSPDGRSIAAACSDKSLHLFDVQTLAHRRTLRGHKDQILSVAFSPDGKLLASASWKGEVRLWELGKDRVKVLSGHKPDVWSLAFSPDGGVLASGDQDGTIRLWSTHNGKTRRVLTGHRGAIRAVAFSPDGRSLASASLDKTIRLWNPATGATMKELVGHGGPVMGVVFSPNGTLLASASWDKTIRLWNPASGRTEGVLRGHTNGVRRLVFSPNGKVLATASWDKTIRIWDLGKRISSRVFSGHTAPISGLSFSPDGKFLASAGWDKTIRLWALSHGIERKKRTGHTGPVNDVAISPDGRTVASAGKDKTVRLWDQATGKEKKVLIGHQEEVTSVAFGPDGQRLASASYDRTVRLWNVKTGVETTSFKGHTGGLTGVTFSPNGALLASGGQDRTIRLWDLNSGGQSRELKGHARSVMALGFSPDSKMLASGGLDRTIRLWDPTSATEHKVLKGVDRIYGISFDPSGKTLASASLDGSIRIWEIKTGTSRLLGRHDGRIYRLSFSPDGEHIGVPCADGAARIWNLRSGSSVSLVGHQSEINSFRFGPRGRLAATASDDGTVRLWDLKTRTSFWRLAIMLPSQHRMFTHEGWKWLKAGAKSESGGASATRWRTAVETRGLRGDIDESSMLLCLQTSGALLEIWDLRKDRRLYKKSIPATEAILALPGGCLTLAKGEVSLHNRNGTTTFLRSRAVAVARHKEDILVAGERKLTLYDTTGRIKGSYETNPGVKAMLRIKRQLFLGFGDGTIEPAPMNAGSKASGGAFGDSLSSSVVSMLEGPGGTLVAGYANGYLIIWSLKNRIRLHHSKLHGPVRYLSLKDSTLYAATELGDHTVLDLSVFKTQYCDLVQEVTRSIPVTWEDGKPISKTALERHDCRASGVD